MNSRLLALAHRHPRLAGPLLLLLGLIPAVSLAATFPLSPPPRPTGFPLSRPGSTAPLVAWGTTNSGRLAAPSNTTALVALAAGGTHSLGLRADGSVVGWGLNANGQITIPASATNVVAIAAGNTHSLALRADGIVLAWGNNGSFQTNVPAAATNIVAIAAGSDHSLAVKSDGRLFVWGPNGATFTTVPANATNVVAVAAGAFHSLALRADGVAVAFGSTVNGQTSVPATATNVVRVASGSSFSLALRADGSVIGWGNNTYGQTTIPTNVAPAVEIAAGGERAMALRQDGTLIGWGLDAFGQSTPPEGLTNVVTFSTGADHTLALGYIPGSFTSLSSNLLAYVGSNTLLQVEGRGTTPAYQWFKDGVLIPGATNSSHLIQSNQLSDTGNYTVSIANELGSLVSSNIYLLVVPFGAPVVSSDGEIVFGSVTRERRTLLSMETKFPLGYIFYTLDGSEPSFSSTLYAGPFLLSNTVVVRTLSLSLDFSQVLAGAATPIVVLPYELRLRTGGAGSITSSPPQRWFATNSLPQILATPNTGWTFLRWEGDAGGSINPLPALMDRTREIKAVFGTSLGTNILGQGTVEISQSLDVPFGTTNVELRAIPAPGHKFVAWGNSLSGTNNPRYYSVLEPSPIIGALFAPGDPGQPFITTAPVPQVVSAGGTFTLTAGATGTGPLTYQWRLNGVALPGATNATLTITGAEAGTAGNYDVVVSGPDGTTTSPGARVSVTLFDLRPVVSILGSAGGTFQVDYTDDLQAGPWLPLTNGVLQADRLDVIDFTTSNRTGRFYRVKQP